MKTSPKKERVEEKVKLVHRFKYPKEYKQFKSIKHGEKPINMKRGVGYYFTTGLLGYNPIGKQDKIKMQSGRTAIAELIDYNLFRDPDDMIKESYWHVSGYEGEKSFKDMSFSEFLKSAYNISL